MRARKSTMFKVARSIVSKSWQYMKKPVFVASALKFRSQFRSVGAAKSPPRRHSKSSGARLTKFGKFQPGASETYKLVVDASRNKNGSALGMVLYSPQHNMIGRQRITVRDHPDTVLLETRAITSGIKWVLEKYPHVKNMKVITDSKFAYDFLIGGVDKEPRDDKPHFPTYNDQLRDFHSLCARFERLDLIKKHNNRTWVADKVAKGIFGDKKVKNRK